MSLDLLALLVFRVLFSILELHFQVNIWNFG